MGEQVEPPVLVREPFECPQCRSTNHRIVGTKRTTVNHKGRLRRAAHQYRTCKDCDHRFQTIQMR